MRNEAASAGPNGEQDAATRVLHGLAQLLARQRAAVQERDTAAMESVMESLSRVLSDVALLAGRSASGAALPAMGEPKALAALALELRDQLRINQALLGIGVAAADHFATAMAGASPGEPSLFSGVA